MTRTYFLLKTRPSKSERRWVIVFAIVVMVTSTAPYLLGYAVQGLDWHFTGFVFSVEDGNSYISKMLSGTVGDWLFRTPYTTFPQRGFFIFLPYILLGKLATPPGVHEQLVALFHLFRVGSGILVILATYEFLSIFIQNVRYRRFGLILASLGGGLGWLLMLFNANGLLGSLPLDFYSPESFGFLSLYIYPHYALARAFLLWGLAEYLKAIATLDNISSIPGKGMKVGFLWVLTGIAQPLTALVLGIIITIYLITITAWQGWLLIRREYTQWPKLRKVAKLTLWAGFLPAPFLSYTIIASRIDPFLKMWVGRSYLYSPHPFHYLIAYGLILPFTILGGKILWRASNWATKLPVAWALFLPLLAYIPVNFQRRLLEGIWVALIVLAMEALESREGSRINHSEMLLIFTFPSTILLLLGGFTMVQHPSEPQFRSTAEVTAFDQLANNWSRNVSVLCSYDTGNSLPAWAPVFVPLGHNPESVGMNNLMPRVKAFYQTKTQNSERMELLAELGIDYVYWGPNERALGQWDPTSASFLETFYQNGNYSIFAVKR